jgi:hypothetical protein
VKCERIAGGFICGRSTVKNRAFKGVHARTPVKPKLTLAIGRIYLVKRYYTGDFRAKCCESLATSVRLKVTDPMHSTLEQNAEIEIPFVHAEFIPALVQDIKKTIEARAAGESREEFERDRFGQSGGSR